MSNAGRKRLDHVVLPRRRPGLAILERYFPSPADNILDAELGANADAGDTILDPWAGTGWTARRAIAAGMRAVAADPSPFAQLAAIAFLSAPEVAVLDAAFNQVASSRRVDVPLRQHLEELYGTHCAACRRPVVGDQFIWPKDAEAPARKIYRCASCDLAVGGPADRVAPVDDLDLAKLGLERSGAPATEAEASGGGDSSVQAGPIPLEPEEELPPAPVGLTRPSDEPALGSHAAVERPAATGDTVERAEDPLDTLERSAEPLDRLGEPGEPPAPRPRVPDPPLEKAPGMPRYASTVRPDPAPQVAAEGNRLGLTYQQLRDRFPVLDGRGELVDELLDLFTPRNLYALQAIANKIDAEIRDTAVAATLRLALAACLLAGSRLNGYPGRVASLRIASGHVRQPASRYQREVNVWRLFEGAYADVRTALEALGRDRRPARFATDFNDLGGITAANVLWIRCRPAVVAEYLPAESVDFVLGMPAGPATADELSFEYLATGWLMGREAAETLRLEPLFGGSSPPSDGAEATAIRRGIASATAALKPGGAFSLLLEGDRPDWMITVAAAAVAAGLELEEIVPRESRRSGDGVALHFRKPSGEDRLRSAVDREAPRLGSVSGHLTYPDLAVAIDRAASGLLRERGEPASMARLAAAFLVESARDGLLRRSADLRGVVREGSASFAGERSGQTPLLATLLSEELWRDDHPSLVRLETPHRPLWWLRNAELAEAPLADRVEWATFSLLSTAGRLDEQSFMGRLFALFPGLSAPDEELVRACLAAYARVDDRGMVRSEERLAERQADHARILRLLVEYAHRLGLKAWIARREHDRVSDDGRLGDALREDERRVYLPLVVRAPGEVLAEVDAIWYVRGRLAFLFEVEWTAMVGEAILRRGRAIPVTEQQARFLVIPAERSELLRL